MIRLCRCRWSIVGFFIRFDVTINLGCVTMLGFSGERPDRVQNTGLCF